MNRDEHVQVVRSEGEKLLQAAGTDLNAPVPTCPGWTVADAVRHVAQLHGWIAEVVSSPSTERPRRPFPEPPEDGELLGWARTQHAALIQALETMDPETPSWTFGADQTLSFFARRMAHETTVHRCDVELAVGALSEIDPEAANDGIDELIEVGMQRSVNPKREFHYPTGSLHIHRTDGAGEWLVHADSGSLVVTHEHAKGDVALRGSAADLLLYLWGRDQGNIEIFGDPDLAVAWASVAP